MKDTQGLNVLVMGVSGSGKTTIGRMLAQELAGEFIDGDDLHPQNNIDKMRQGIPLNDGDRQPWLSKVAECFATAKRQGKIRVIACSALKRQYRDVLRSGDSKLCTLFLNPDPQLLKKRMLSREHFMPTALLQSQLDTLESPTGEGLTFEYQSASGDISAQHITSAFLSWLLEERIYNGKQEI
ncbi:gluconokinase [Glaciecola siphonariae]|uniref:Gluconokinase n=1 Tax=Glaciecola siphonariae TaxID=521012 RepID=A0ABV9LY98_9ALTE